MATSPPLRMIAASILLATVASSYGESSNGQMHMVTVPSTTPVPATTSQTEPLAFDEPTVDKFFSTVQSQLHCGYPMFGIPSLAPLKLSYTLKTSFDLLQLKKINIVASNFTVHGLNNFTWNAAKARFTRTSASVIFTFPNVTAFAQTTLNGANGTSYVEMRNITVLLNAQYEEKDDLLYITELGGSIALEDAKVRIASLFPKSVKLTKIWNRAIGKSMPILVELFNGGKLKIEYLNRLLSGAKFYAMNTINNGLSTYSLNFDRLAEAMVKFSNGTSDSLQCDPAAVLADGFAGWLRTGSH
uniref:Uncharacterized protein n=1 Tax=Anopheles atroparvus TaxID=41427 RepID=A0A182JKS6_ANOAO